MEFSVATGRETATHSALVVGDIGASDREAAAQAARRAGASLAFCRTPEQALARMGAGHTLPLCVLVWQGTDAASLVRGMREDARLFGVPVVMAVPFPSNDAYREAYLAGADDVLVAADNGAITRRLANLALNRTGERPAAKLGRVVVVSSAHAARTRIGRTLRQVGFDVTYAAELCELLRLTRGEQAPVFAVTTDAVDPSLVTDHEHGSCGEVVRIGNVPVLVLASHELESPLNASDPGVDLTGKLLFFADEQAKAPFKDRRASARKLHSTICAFREAGSMQAVYGVSHNVSRDGMYVRTLDPPRSGSTIWLELHAPQSGELVHLRATVMWRRLPGSGPGALPPGFGLRIDAAQCPTSDLQAFIAGYEQLPG